MEKQDILDAIRRTAIDNGGKPLGRQRFHAETGITQTQLYKHWRNYGAAVAEAGYEANEFNAPHPEEHLLRSLALLVRDLGDFPSHADLAMRRHNDPSFPNESTFRRLGNKQAKIARLAAYTAEHPEFADVAAICGPLVAGSEATVATEPDDRTKIEAGFVYLFWSTTRGHKIGWTTSMSRRWAEIEREEPGQVELLHHFKTVDARGIENYWHDRFDAQRIVGNREWFTLTSKHVAEFKRRSKSM